MVNIQGFTAAYAGNGGKSYISFTVPAEENIVQYQAEMLERNHIGFLLPLSVQRLNNDWKLSYEITSKVPLVKVLERKSLKYDEFANIIKQIGKLSFELKDYLLDVSSVIFDTSYIYCDPGDLSLYFIYFPVRSDNTDFSMMRDFIQNLIFDDIRLQDDSAGSLLKRILDVLKSDNFTPELLLKSLRPEQQDSVGNVKNHNNIKSNSDINKNRAGYPASGLTGTNPDRNEVHTAKAKAMNETGKTTSEKNENYNKFICKYPLKSYITAGAANLLLIGLIIYVLITRKNSGNFAGTLLGFALVGIAGNYFIFSRLFGTENEAENENNGKLQKPAFKPAGDWNAGSGAIPPEKRPVFFSSLPGQEKFSSVNPEFQAYKDEYESMPEQMNPSKAGISGSDKTVLEKFKADNRKNVQNNKPIQDKTVILGYASRNIPYLQNLACPAERIYITKDSMLLGRLSDSVDYTIQNKAVGKIHAEIKKREGSYYIIDLNSVNGTYVNNERITCSTEIKLNNGDIVTLANESYTFVI